MIWSTTSDRGEVRRSAGFSLLEMSVSVIIIGIMAAVVIPYFWSTDPSARDLAAQEIADAFRFARSESVRLGKPHGVWYSAAQQRIRVFRPDTGTTPWTPIYDIPHPVSKKPYDIQLEIHSFAKADSIEINPVYRGACNLAGQIYFDLNGTPRCIDPETVLIESLDVTVTLGGQSRIVSLQGLTGQVEVQ